MRIIYLGSGKFGIECLNALTDSNHTLVFIVTGSPQPAGRGRRPTPTPVAGWAKSHSREFVETDNVNTPEVFDRIAAYQPDLLLAIAFGQKIGSQLINLPPKGAVNVHASLLPKYRGAAPINRAIINGEKQTGVSIITLAEKIDAGDILAQTETDIAENETAGELHDRLAQMAAPLLLKTLNKIADGSITYTRQEHSKATLAPKLKKSDGFLDFTEPAETIKRKIRGLTPWPGASATYLSKQTGKSEMITIVAAEKIETSNPAELPAGTLDENLNVICGDDALKITKIKPAGRSLMNFEDFANGRRTKLGDLLMKIEK